MIPLLKGDLVRFAVRTALASTFRVTLNMVSPQGKPSSLSVDAVGTADRQAAGASIGFGNVTEDTILYAAAVTTIVGTVPQYRGECHVTVTLMRGGSPFCDVINDYVSDGYECSYPTFKAKGYAPDGLGRGFFRLVTSANPAAGAEIAEIAVPDNAMWLAHFFHVQLVQGATQTPRPQLLIRDAADATKLLLPANQAMGASTTEDFFWARGSSVQTIAGVSQLMPFPDIVLPQNWTLITSTSGIGANSNYGVPEILVEEWIMSGGAGDL